MALTHLIDTSVVSRLADPGIRAVIDPLAGSGRIGRAGMIAKVTGQACSWVVRAGTID